MKWLAFGLLIYLLLAAAVWAFQRALLYHPQPQGLVVPTVRVQGATATVHAAVRQPEQHQPEQHQAVVYFGGNAEDVAQTLPSLALAFPDRAIYALHYRGFGPSQGQPTEPDLVADALALAQQVLGSHRSLTLVGRSLGSGVAVQVAAALAAEPRLERLVLVTPYDSMAMVAQGHYPWLPARWLIKDKFDSAAHAPQVRVPTLLLVAEQDVVVPKARAQGLMQAFKPGLARWEELPGTDHNTIGAHPRYASLLGASHGL